MVILLVYKFMISSLNKQVHCFRLYFMHFSIWLLLLPDSLLVCVLCHLQGEALGFSFWWGDEVHLGKVLWLPAAAEGELQVSS